MSSDYSPPALASDNSGAAVDWGDPESEDGFAAPFPHPPKKVQSYPVVQSTLTPRSIQTEALAKFMEAIQEGGKSKRVIVSLPTGGGKTVFGLMVAGQINGRVLWLAHRDELIDQPEAAVLATMPGLSCSVEKASRTSWDSRFVIASVQTLENPARVKNLLSNGPFDVVIYDECHHATAQASRTLLAQLGCMRRDGKGPHLLGLTATIERSDETSLLHVFDELIYNLSIQAAIDRGYLVPPVPIKVNLPINPRSLRVVNGEISSGDLDKELTRVNAAQATAATIMAHCKGRKTIVFCVSVDQAKRTSDACATLGLKAAWVSGTSYKRKVKKYRPDGSEETVEETRVGMSRAERKHVLKMFHEGTIDILTSADLLVEGFDEPSVSAVVIAKPTLSKSRYIQMVGRGLRIFLGKKDCLVIDLVSASDFGLVTSGVLQDPVEKDKRLGGGGGGGSGENELCKVWKYIKSTTEGEYKDCGDIVFAKASDDIWITAAADGDLVVIRRVEGSEEWMVEHDSQAQSFPMSLQACMEHCRDVVMKQFGGGAAPGTKAWDKATDKPMPMPAFLPDAAPVQTVDPMPVTMTAGSGDLLQAAADELYARHVNAFLDGVAAALERGYCHFEHGHTGSKLPPKVDPATFGWQVPAQFKSPTPRGRCAGYVKSTNVYVNLSVGIEVSAQTIQALVANADHVKRKRSASVEGGVEFVKFDCGDLLKRIES